MPEIISIWKAPKKKLAAKQLRAGFRRSDFKGAPGQFPNGRAYFAKDRKLAEMYASSYQGGIIEIQMLVVDYKVHFQKFENRYSGSNEIELAIPRDFLKALNKMTIRRIWHHD